jgi:hypothetical protein
VISSDQKKSFRINHEWHTGCCLAADQKISCDDPVVMYKTHSHRNSNLGLIIDQAARPIYKICTNSYALCPTRSTHIENNEQNIEFELLKF